MRLYCGQDFSSPRRGLTGPILYTAVVQDDTAVVMTWTLIKYTSEKYVWQSARGPTRLFEFEAFGRVHPIYEMLPRQQSPFLPPMAMVTAAE